MESNRILFERIKGVLERPAYKKKVMYDSKAVAAKASLSPTMFNQTMNTDVSGALSRRLDDDVSSQ